MCTVLLPPDDNPITVKYATSYHIINHISCHINHIASYHIIYHISYRIIYHILYYIIYHVSYHIILWCPVPDLKLPPRSSWELRSSGLVSYITAGLYRTGCWRGYKQSTSQAKDFWFKIIMWKGNAVPLQAWSGPDGSRRLRFPNFNTIGTWSSQGCQP